MKTIYKILIILSFVVCASILAYSTTKSEETEWRYDKIRVDNEIVNESGTIVKSSNVISIIDDDTKDETSYIKVKDLTPISSQYKSFSNKLTVFFFYLKSKIIVEKDIYNRTIVYYLH